MGYPSVSRHRERDYPAPPAYDDPHKAYFPNDYPHFFHHGSSSSSAYGGYDDRRGSSSRQEYAYGHPSMPPAPPLMLPVDSFHDYYFYGRPPYAPHSSSPNSIPKNSAPSLIVPYGDRWSYDSPSFSYRPSDYSYHSVQPKISKGFGSYGAASDGVVNKVRQYSFGTKKFVNKVAPSSSQVKKSITAATTTTSAAAAATTEKDDKAVEPEIIIEEAPAIKDSTVAAMASLSLAMLDHRITLALTQLNISLASLATPVTVIAETSGPTVHAKEPVVTTEAKESSAGSLVSSVVQPTLKRSISAISDVSNSNSKRTRSLINIQVIDSKEDCGSAELTPAVLPTPIPTPAPSVNTSSSAMPRASTSPSTNVNVNQPNVVPKKQTDVSAPVSHKPKPENSDEVGRKPSERKEPRQAPSNSAHYSSSAHMSDSFKQSSNARERHSSSHGGRHDSRESRRSPPGSSSSNDHHASRFSYSGEGYNYADPYYVRERERDPNYHWGEYHDRGHAGVYDFRPQDCYDASGYYAASYYPGMLEESMQANYSYRLNDYPAERGREGSADRRFSSRPPAGPPRKR
eukprot:scaffold2801_cov161-Ochromonas_danica.AAC.12